MFAEKMVEYTVRVKKMSNKNPNWKEEELILVLNLYFAHDLKWLNSASERTNEIIEMSNLLRSLELFDIDVRSVTNFRSPSSVHMKLMNFKGLDPKYGKYGLRNTGNLDREVWSKYLGDTLKLKIEAENILKKYKNNVDTDIEKEIVGIDEKLKICISYLTKINILYLEIRKEAIDLSDIDLSQKLINSMYEELNFTKDKITMLENLFNNFQKNDNVSLEIDKSNTNSSDSKKIGKYIKESFSNLINEKILTKDEITKLQDEDWSRKNFHIGHPFLKKVQANIPIDLQMKVGKYQRYWKNEFEIYGNKYLVCKEWYESNRKLYNLWIENITLASKNNIIFPKEYNSTSIKKELFIYILNIIRKLDEEEICIEISKLNDLLMNEIEKESYYKDSKQTISIIIKYLLDKKIIIPFQNNTKGKYIIEDYELMSNFMSKPEEILRK